MLARKDTVAVMLQFGGRQLHACVQGRPTRHAPVAGLAEQAGQDARPAGASMLWRDNRPYYNSDRCFGFSEHAPGRSCR